MKTIEEQLEAIMKIMGPKATRGRKLSNEQKKLVTLALVELKKLGRVRLIEVLKVMEAKHNLDCIVSNSKHGAALYFGLMASSKIKTEKIGNKRFVETI